MAYVVVVGWRFRCSGGSEFSAAWDALELAGWTQRVPKLGLPNSVTAPRPRLLVSCWLLRLYGRCSSPIIHELRGASR